MALATTCPQCKTSFKVVPDQLKLRRGLVRCGVCQHVFSGIDYLRYVDDAARTAQRLARERAAAEQAGASTAGPGQPGPGQPSAGQPNTVPATAATPGPRPTPSDPTPATADRRETAAPAPSAPPLTAAAAPADTPQAPRTPGGIVTAVGGTSGTFAPSEASAGPTAAPDDPWAAAAHAAHEHSLRDGPADDAPSSADPLRGAGSLAPGAFEPSGTFEPSRTFEPSSTFEPSHDAALAAPPPDEARPVPSTAPSAGHTDTSEAALAPATGFPALPAPAPSAAATRRPAAASLDDLLARPTVPWPTASGPQTIISGDEDLKTAFFLPDSAFGPQTVDESANGPRTVSGPPTRLDAVDPDPITRLRPEARAAQREEDAAGIALRAPRGFFDTDTIDSPMPELATAPSRGEARGPERAIDYFPGVRNRSRGLGLALSPAAWIGATALTLLLGLQGLVGWRDAIAARAPFVAPVLAAVLSPFGAEISPPREIDALTIEGFELQAAGSPNVLHLSAVLRNRSGHVVGYPAMELTLTDSVGALLVRKVIPVDAWLPDPAVRAAGIAGGTERPLRLALEHNGLQPTGYAVALFYP